MYERFLGRIADDGRRKIEAIQSFGEDKILFVKGRTDSPKENPVCVNDKGCDVDNLYCHFLRFRIRSTENSQLVMLFFR